MSHIVSFLRFWYDFIVGDDWLIAAAVAAALVATWLVAHAHAAAWWLLPVAVVLVLGFSLWRAVPPAHKSARSNAYAGDRATSRF